MELEIPIEPQASSGGIRIWIGFWGLGFWFSGFRVGFGEQNHKYVRSEVYGCGWSLPDPLSTLILAIHLFFFSVWQAVYLPCL